MIYEMEEGKDKQGERWNSWDAILIYNKRTDILQKCKYISKYLKNMKSYGNTCVRKETKQWIRKQKHIYLQNT